MVMTVAGECVQEVPGAARERASVGSAEELAVLAGQLNVAHAGVVRVVARALVSGAWQGWGITGPDHWLRWCMGLSSLRARQLVDIARRVDELPVTFAVFEAGLLTVDQAALIFRRVPAHNDAEIARLAPNATVEQLRAIVYRYPFDRPPRPTPETDPDPKDADANGADANGAGDAGAGPAGAPPSPSNPNPIPNPVPAGSSPVDEAVRAAMAAGRVVHGFGEDGRFFLHADLPADEGAIVAQALAEARDRLFGLHGAGVTWSDALVDVAERSLAAVDSPERRDRYRTYLVVDQRGPWIVGGPPIPQPLFDKLNCDTVLYPVHAAGGVPLSVGRAQRNPSNHTRRLTRHRDLTCRFPGCARTRGLQLHHIIPWSHGGPTDTANLVHLCTGATGHHNAVHRGDITIDGNADRPDGHPDGLVFRDRRGRPVLAKQPATPPGATPPPAPPEGHRYRRPPGDPLHLDLIDFTNAPAA